MIREVNLIGHLPEFIQNYREIKGIMSAEEPELQLLEDDSERIKNNMFVLYSDEAGIERYEKMFGLIPSQKDTLQNRQTKVLAYYTNSVSHTLPGLIERLNVLCGVENYTLELIPNEYTIIISLHLRVKNLMDTIRSVLTNTVPANMICNYIVKYNTHKDLAKYPEYLLMQFTNQELFEEVIEDDSFSATCDNITNYTMESFEAVSCENMLNYGMRKV